MRIVLFIVCFGAVLIMSEKLKEYFMVTLMVSLIQPKGAAHMLVKLESKENHQFPTNFSFGSASSSFQVEGAWNEDGKGPSIWDTFVQSYPERVADRSTPDIGPNSYHFFKEDVQALQQVGVNNT